MYFPCLPSQREAPVFVGHYAISFAVKRAGPTIPLWVLFFAVQLLDVGWSAFVLLGIEKVRIVPGITASNPLDLYYMPYTHSLVAALLWSAGAYVTYRLAVPNAAARTPLLVALAVFSHWILDFVVHRPDLPLFDNRAKVGLGLWDYPAFAFALEAGLLFLAMWAYFRLPGVRRWPIAIFGLVMLGIQGYVFFGPPPASDRAAAATALAAYGLFAGVIWRLDQSAQVPSVTI
jgi:hypothetical protein